MAKEDRGDGDGGEQRNTRFPCLATARTLVATVVSVLAAVVVVMVIIVLNRPEKIDLFINYGYIQAEQMWWNKTQRTTSAAAVATQVSHDGSCRPMMPAVQVGSGGGSNQMIADVRRSRTTTTATDDDCDDVTTAVYKPVDKVVLQVAVTGYNPSNRRGKTIRCNVTAVRVVDVTGVAIASVEHRPEDKDKDKVVLTLQPQGTYIQRWTVAINDSRTLHYLNNIYQQRTSFTTMVQLDVAYSEKIGNISFYCSPVTLGYGVPSTTKLDDVTVCKSSAEMVGYNVTWYPPPLVTNH